MGTVKRFPVGRQRQRERQRKRDFLDIAGAIGVLARFEPTGHSAEEILRDEEFAETLSAARAFLARRPLSHP